MNWLNVVRLRLYLGENDKCQGEPAYEVLIKTARSKKLHGATVFSGCHGVWKAQSHSYQQNSSFV